MNDRDRFLAAAERGRLLFAAYLQIAPEKLKDPNTLNVSQLQWRRAQAADMIASVLTMLWQDGVIVSGPEGQELLGRAMTQHHALLDRRWKES